MRGRPRQIRDSHRRVINKSAQKRGGYLIFYFCFIFKQIHRIHKWRTRGKKLVPSHESEALEDKQKLQMKTFNNNNKFY